MMKDPENFNSALLACFKEKCPKWKEWDGRDS
jgi:hypothetical protein